MRKRTAKKQLFTTLLSEEQKRALKIDFPSLLKRMEARLAKFRGEATPDNPFSRFNYQHVHQPS